jgi:hypothetical protein
MKRKMILLITFTALFENAAIFAQPVLQSPQPAPESSQPFETPQPVPESSYAPETPQSVPPSAAGQHQDAYAYFYAQLQPYGRWIWHEQYGWIWTPYNVPLDWRPYSDGHWEYTDAGWTWISNDPWGWACFHYGRWFFDDRYGWCWYPDTVWAPSWVTWRSGDDWIGWAPLPPQAVWDNVLIFTDEETNAFIPWFGYSFCHHEEFLSHDLHHRIRDPIRNTSFIKRTHHHHDPMRRADHHIVVEGAPVKDIEQAVHHPIERSKIVDVNSPRATSSGWREVRVYRPQFRGRTTSYKLQPKQTTPSAPAAPSLVPSRKETSAAPTRSQEQLEQQIQRTEEIQHQNDERAYQRMQTQHQRLLEQEERQELERPPHGMTSEQLKEQHTAEWKAYQDQAQREQRLMQNRHTIHEKTLIPKTRPSPSQRSPVQKTAPSTQQTVPSGPQSSPIAPAVH